MSAWLTSSAGGVRIEVRVTPKASRNAVGSVEAGRLRIQVTAPPENGKANEAVRKLLAKRLRVGKSSIEIVRGETARDKSLIVAGVQEQSTRAELEG